MNFVMYCRVRTKSYIHCRETNEKVKHFSVSQILTSGRMPQAFFLPEGSSRQQLNGCCTSYPTYFGHDFDTLHLILTRGLFDFHGQSLFFSFETCLFPIQFPYRLIDHTFVFTHNFFEWLVLPKHIAHGECVSACVCAKVLSVVCLLLEDNL